MTRLKESKQDSKLKYPSSSSSLTAPFKEMKGSVANEYAEKIKSKLASLRRDLLNNFFDSSYFEKLSERLAFVIGILKEISSELEILKGKGEKLDFIVDYREQMGNFDASVRNIREDLLKISQGFSRENIWGYTKEDFEALERSENALLIKQNKKEKQSNSDGSHPLLYLVYWVFIKVVHII